MDPEDGGAWKPVPKIDGALQVLVGDHIEVLSNGLYKSLVHGAVLNSERTRISIASLHSLGMDENMALQKNWRVSTTQWFITRLVSRIS